MKLSGKFVLLRVLATAAIGIFIYSGSVTLRTALFGADGGLLAISLFGASMLSGHLAGWLFWNNKPKVASYLDGSRFIRFFSFMLHIKDGAGFITAAAVWSAILMPLLASLLLYGHYGIGRILFEVPLAMIAYIISLKHSRLAATQIMNNAAVYTGFFILALCLEAPYFSGSVAYLRPWLFAATYFFILAYLIIKNQEDIDRNIFDKKHVEKSILPKNLRRFNLLSVCFVFFAIILFFNLKPVIIYILQLLGYLTTFIIKGVLWAMEHLLPSLGTEPQGGAAVQDFNLFGEASELTNPFINLIFNIIKNFIMLYAAYRVLLYLTRKLHGLLRKAIEWIKKLLSLNAGRKPMEAKDYSDETETLKPVKKHDNLRRVIKKMRKSRRDLRNISDPVERIRHMYSTILQMLPLLGVQREQCDTTMDILKKTVVRGELSKELEWCTKIYNHVRYGEKIPDASMLAEAEGHFGRVAKVIGRNNLSSSSFLLK